MQSDQFMAQVQHQAHLSSRGEAARAVRATLESLSIRLERGLSEHIASQLPLDIGEHLRLQEPFCRLSLSDFYRHVAAREGVDLPKSVFHARVVIGVLCQALSPSMIAKIQGDLPKEFRTLFAVPEETSHTPAPAIDRHDHLLVKDVMTRGAQVAAPDCPIQVVAERMRGLNAGCIPICEGSRIIGMVTDRDIALRAVAEGRGPMTTEAREVMTPEVVYCFEDEDIEVAVRNMESRQIRRLLVLDRQNRLAGIVSLGDVALHLEGRDDGLTAEALERISERRSVLSRDEIPALH